MSHTKRVSHHLPIAGETLETGKTVQLRQLTLMHMILLGSLCLQLWFLPWKSPILNLVDGVSVSLLVMLLAGSLGYADSSGEDATRVLATFGTVISSLMVVILGGMVLLGLAALVYRSALGSSKELRVMNLGKVPEEKDVFQSLLDVATFLKEDGQGKEQTFIKDLGNLSVYDIGTITRAVNILADDLNMVVSQNGSIRKSSSRRIATGTRSIRRTTNGGVGSRNECVKITELHRTTRYVVPRKPLVRSHEELCQSRWQGGPRREADESCRGEFRTS